MTALVFSLFNFLFCRMKDRICQYQMRIMNPKQAFENKVTGIVIGRSLTKGNIKNNTKKLADHLYK